MAQQSTKQKSKVKQKRAKAMRVARTGWASISEPAPEPTPDPKLNGTSSIGRPTKFVPEIVAALTDALSSGMNQEQACVRADISTSTLHEWKKHAESGDERFRGFLDALTRARVDGIRARLTNIVTAASEGFEFKETVEITEEKLDKSDKKIKLTKTTQTTRTSPPDWKAAAWWLERVESKQFGPMQKNELSGPNGGKIPVEVSSSIERIYGNGSVAPDDAKDEG